MIKAAPVQKSERNTTAKITDGERGSSIPPAGNDDISINSPVKPS